MELRDGATLKFYPNLFEWKIAEQGMTIKVCSIIMFFIFYEKNTQSIVMLINHRINLFKDYHGYQGLIKVTDAEETPKITEALLKAVQDIGESITDVNGKEQKGEPPFFQHGYVCMHQN